MWPQNISDRPGAAALELGDDVGTAGRDDLLPHAQANPALDRHRQRPGDVRLAGSAQDQRRVDRVDADQILEQLYRAIQRDLLPAVVFLVRRPGEPLRRAAELDVDLHERLLRRGAVPVFDVRRRVLAAAGVVFLDRLAAPAGTHAPRFGVEQLSAVVAVPRRARAGLELAPAAVTSLASIAVTTPVKFGSLPPAVARRRS